MNWHSIKTAPKNGNRLLWKHENGDVYLVKWLPLYNSFTIRSLMPGSNAYRLVRFTRQFIGWQYAGPEYKHIHLPYERFELTSKWETETESYFNGTGKVKVR